MTVTTQASARRQGRRVVDRLARLGLAARGVVYLLVAWIAIRIAFLHSGQQADRQGAMRQIAHNTAGKALLLAMAVGFFGYAAWRIVQAVSGFPDEDGAKEWGKRAVSAGRALLYLAFAYSAARTALSGQTGSGSDRTSKRATAGVLAHSGGRALVVAAGVGFIIAGVALAVRGVMRKFESHLDTGRMSGTTEKVVATLGVAGQTARGVIFAMIGGFLIDAAVSYDPHKARGLDGALRALGNATAGRLLLAVVALGLACFGAYSLAESRYRQT
jgi:Domain of Unknown Function (DUF1206)